MPQQSGKAAKQGHGTENVRRIAPSAQIREEAHSKECGRKRCGQECDGADFTSAKVTHCR
jgi:hypothetical protein